MSKKRKSYSADFKQDAVSRRTMGTMADRRKVARQVVHGLNAFAGTRFLFGRHLVGARKDRFG
jgi:hypothetical protein